VKRSIIAAVFAASLFIAPIVHADANYVPVGDPYTDTLQLWSEVLYGLAAVANQMGALFSLQEFVASSNTGNTEEPASAATSIETATNATSDQTTLSRNIKSAEPGPASINSLEATNSSAADSPAQSVLSKPTPAFNTSNFVTQSELSQELVALSNSLTAKFNVSAVPAIPQYIVGGGNSLVPYAAVSGITNLSNVTITNPTIAGLTASEIPDLSGKYLSLNSGGAVAGTTTFATSVGIGPTSPSDTFALNGAAPRHPPKRSR
jgi:hypothetical protein